MINVRLFISSPNGVEVSPISASKEIGSVHMKRPPSVRGSIKESMLDAGA